MRIRASVAGYARDVRTSASQPATSSWVVGRLTIFLLFSLVPHSAVGAHGERPGTLFVGNSMTYFNAGPTVYGALDAHRRAVDVIVGSGFSLARHLEEGRWPWTRMAALPYLARGRYRTLVLQDAGWRMFMFPRDPVEREAALTSALALARHGRTWGARVVLYVQPYRADAESCLATMIGQDQVIYGYHQLAAALRLDGIDVRIAPVGQASALAATKSVNPCGEGTEFDMLFARDNHHPSLRGTYLAMALIYAVANDVDVRDVPDEPRLGHEVSLRLRTLAHAALERERSRPDH